MLVVVFWARRLTPLIFTAFLCLPALVQASTPETLSVNIQTDQQAQAFKIWLEGQMDEDRRQGKTVSFHGHQITPETLDSFYLWQNKFEQWLESNRENKNIWPDISVETTDQARNFLGQLHRGSVTLIRAGFTTGTMHYILISTVGMPSDIAFGIGGIMGVISGAFSWYYERYSNFLQREGRTFEAVRNSGDALAREDRLISVMANFVNATRASMNWDPLSHGVLQQKFKHLFRHQEFHKSLTGGAKYIAVTIPILGLYATMMNAAGHPIQPDLLSTAGWIGLSTGVALVGQGVWDNLLSRELTKKLNELDARKKVLQELFQFPGALSKNKSEVSVLRFSISTQMAAVAFSSNIGSMVLSMDNPSAKAAGIGIYGGIFALGAYKAYRYTQMIETRGLCRAVFH